MHVDHQIHKADTVSLKDRTNNTSSANCGSMNFRRQPKSPKRTTLAESAGSAVMPATICSSAFPRLADGGATPTCEPSPAVTPAQAGVQRSLRSDPTYSPAIHRWVEWTRPQNLTYARPRLLSPRGSTNALLGLHQFANTHIDGPRGILYILRQPQKRPTSRQLVAFSLFQRVRGRESGVEQRCIQGSSLLVLQSVSLAPIPVDAV